MKLTNEAVRAAIDDCLSGAQALPSVRADVLNQLRGEVKVKKKFSVGIVFALLLTLLMAGAALAAGLGLFGQMSENGASDARLPGLERVSESLDLTFETAEGVTVTVDQVYYDGSRVFISYTKTGPYDVMTLGEGKPEVDKWDWEMPGEVYGESFDSDSPNHAVMAEHLDGSAPRWAKTCYVNVHDGVQIGEEYLDIISGDTYRTEDGALVGWKECVVPEELAKDEVTFLLGTFTTNTTYYQDETGLYMAYGSREATTWHPFTVKKDAGGKALTGTVSGEEWVAKAELTASAIDVKGEIIVRCPESWVDYWVNWDAPADVDCIRDWKFYVGGVQTADWVVQGVYPCCEQSDNQLIYEICSKLDDMTQEMKLVPVYRHTGEHMDEAIVLKIAE